MSSRPLFGTSRVREVAHDSADKNNVQFNGWRMPRPVIAGGGNGKGDDRIGEHPAFGKKNFWLGYILVQGYFIIHSNRISQSSLPMTGYN